MIPSPVAAEPARLDHEAPERSHESRFVGRDNELGFIREAWQRALTGQCELVTVVGDPGIGKSRLVAEALATLDVRVVRGRCLPYGEGITYWPVVEVIKQLDALPSDQAAAAAISSLLGESKEGTSADQIAWAFRKFLEEQTPLVAVFDDIQWGEEPFSTSSKRRPCSSPRRSSFSAWRVLRCWSAAPPGRESCSGNAARISTAARQARRASSSCTCGTPNTAITASPMNFSTEPPCDSTIAFIRSK